MDKYNFVPRVQRALESAIELAVKNNHEKVNCAHILYTCLEISSLPIKNLLEKNEIDIVAFKKCLMSEFVKFNKNFFLKEEGEQQWSKDVEMVIEKALELSLELDQHFIGMEHVFFSILKNCSEISAFLKSKGVNVDEICKDLFLILNSKNAGEKQPEASKSRDEDEEKFTTKYCHNLNNLVSKNETRVEGRDLEIDKLVEILSCKIKNNAILVGDPGTGKTAIVEGLAQRINDLECPVYFAGFKIYSLDLGLMVAGTKYRGQFEERFKGLLEELKRDSQAILFIDEIHSIVGAGSSEGTLDLANMIKPALARGEIKCIGATTQIEYKKYFEKDGALNRRFQLINIEEPSKKQTFEILKKAKDKYEKFHGVSYTDEMITKIIDFSDRFLPYRKFPDKAFDILDRIGANGKIKKFVIPKSIKDQESKIFSFIEKENMELDANKSKCERMLNSFLKKRNSWIKNTSDLILEIDHSHIIEVVSKISGLSKEKLEYKGRNFNLLKQEMKQVIFDQNEAIDKIYNVLLCSKVGIKTSKKTLANLLFVGSTGVGKTFTAKVIAEKFYNKPNSFLQIDMAEYVEKNSVSKLLGTTAGYVGYEEGGLLSEFVRNNPNSLILFDEVEKAHPEVVNILLEIMDEGFIIDNFNRNINFKNCIIVMTGNIGAEYETSKSMGFVENKNSQIRNSEYESAVKKHFKPELISRIDEILIFNNKFTKDGLLNLINSSFKEVEKSLSERQITLNSDKEIQDLIFNMIQNEPSNARNIQKIIRNTFELPLCEFLVDNENITEIHAKVVDKAIEFSIIP
jgi:ATP-dependent Clp protease ATP-binding subunit ClpC